MKKCKIIMDNIMFIITLRKTLTAKIIYDNLPIIGDSHKWGKEYYFYTNLKINMEKSARAIINKGEIAYWPNGNAIAIGYGTTPISVANEIRLADKCNIWGYSKSNLHQLDLCSDNDSILIEKIE